MEYITRVGVIKTSGDGWGCGCGCDHCGGGEAEIYSALQDDVDFILYIDSILTCFVA